MGVIDLRDQKPRRRVAKQDEDPRSGQRPLPLRARRRRARIVMVASGVCGVVLLIAGISFASHLRQYSIQEISVTGTIGIDPTIVRDYARSILDDGRFHLLSRQNIFLYPRA